METDFAPGDIIEFADDLFLVLENYGHGGKVLEYGNTTTVNNFKWQFQDEKCLLVQNRIVSMLKQCIEIMKEHHVDADKYDCSDFKIFISSIAGNYGHIFFTSKENCSKIAFDVGHVNNIGELSDLEVSLTTDWIKQKRIDNAKSRK